MKAKNKVLNLEPNAMCWHYKDEDTGKTTCWVSIGCDGNKCLSKSKPRESWAWAEALRNLNIIHKSNKQIEEVRKLIHQYSDEDEMGNRIWRDYNPAIYEPQTDTRTL